jgi:hypothetical protein
MILGVAFRLVRLLGGLVVATVLIVAMMAVLSSTSLAGRDHVAAVQQAVKAPAQQAADCSPTPLVVLVFAGIVLLAALPPVHRIHVHHRSYQRTDWI